MKYCLSGLCYVLKYNAAICWVFVQTVDAVAGECCSSMPVLRRLTKVFRKRRGTLDITPVVDEIREISGPTDFHHNCHVGLDNGELVGLPPAWNQWLQNSDITYVCCFISNSPSSCGLQYSLAL